MNKNCEKTTKQSQNILHEDTLYNILRKKYKTVSAELAFAKVTFDRMVAISYRLYNFYLLCSWIIAIFKMCMIKGRNSHCLFIHKLYFNASKLYQKWEMLQNVCHIYCFQVQMYLFYISKLNNAIYMLGVTSLDHKHHVAGFF